MADVTDDYYASDAIVGYGGQAKVGQGDGSPETFTAIPEINKIGGLVKLMSDVIEVTHLRSLNRHKEKRVTMRDSAPITLEGNYLPDHGAHKVAGGDGFDADHSLLSLSISGASNNFELSVIKADGTELSLTLVGSVTGYEAGEVAVGGKIPFSCTITPLHDYFTN